MQEKDFKQKLVQRYADDKATAEELEVFFHLLKEEQLDTQLSEAMDEEAGKAYPAIASVHRVHFLKTSWFRYAAAVVLIAGGAIAYVISSDSEKSPSIATNKSLSTDIAPGSNKAVLTLADGSTIVLDNAANGNLAQQGSTKIIKLDNGQLAYQLPRHFEGATATEKSLLYNTISTPRGGQYQIVLPDGSKVWLNAASSIKFPASFTGTRRNVEVTGEVYMEIAKNLKQPFSVTARGTKIDVLGTSFNVNAYEDEEVLKTTLIEGSVKVLAAGKESLLKPGQEALVVKEGLAVQLADIEQTLAWKNGVFQFNRTPLADAMRQLSRWYDVEVMYSNGIPAIKLGGKMKRDLSLNQVLDGLGELGVKFKIEGKRLIVL